MEKNKAISIKSTNDLIEIEAQYHKDFTATADADLDELIVFLVAYINSPKEKLPDMSLSIQLDSEVLIKNLTLIEDDIRACSLSILENSFSIVSELALTTLKRTKKKLMLEPEASNILGMIDHKENRLEVLKSMILYEHGTDIAESMTIELQ